MNAQPTGTEYEGADDFSDMEPTQVGQSISDALSSGSSISGTAPSDTPVNLPGISLKVSGSVSAYGGAMDADSVSSDMHTFSAVEGLSYTDTSFAAVSAQEFSSENLLATSAEGITGDSDSLYIEKAIAINLGASVAFKDIEGFERRGDAIYIRKGGIVVDGTDSYLDIMDSTFKFKDGRFVSADVNSGKDENSFLVRGASIIVQKGNGLTVNHSGNTVVKSKNDILFRRSEHIRAYSPTTITYNDRIKHVTLSNNSRYYLENGFAVISDQEVLELSMTSCEANCIDIINRKAAFSGHFTIEKNSTPIIVSRSGSARMTFSEDLERISLSCGSGVTAYSGTFEIDCAVPRFRFTSEHPYTITDIEPNTVIVPGMLTSGNLRMYEHNSPQYTSILQDFNRYISRGFR